MLKNLVILIVLFILTSSTFESTGFTVDKALGAPAKSKSPKKHVRFNNTVEVRTVRKYTHETQSREERNAAIADRNNRIKRDKEDLNPGRENLKVLQNTLLNAAPSVK